MTQQAELTIFPTWTAGRKGYAERVRELFREYHQKKNLRLTPQRQAILDHLLAAERHLSQKDIYAALRGRGIGRVTVFRTLKILMQAGLADHVDSQNGHARYEILLERPHHDHLVCIECGRIIEVSWPEVERIQDRECRKLGFAITVHRHEVFGRCKSCQEKAR